jgi:hypothetical protein
MLNELENIDNTMEKLSSSDLSDQVISSYEEYMERSLTKTKKNAKVNSIKLSNTAKMKVKKNVQHKKTASNTRNNQKPRLRIASGSQGS